MSENDYVATAAAEKRLREVLADRLPGATERSVDDLTVVLLDGARIEYKSRAKQVAILLDLPETATTRKPKPKPKVDDPDQAVTETEGAGNELGATPEPVSVPSDGYPDKQTYDEAQLARVYGGESETVKAPPIPHIVPFTPVIDADADYEDVHYD